MPISITSGSSLVVGGRSYLLAPLQDNGGQVANVKAFRAVGDGVTNDTTPIRNARNACPNGGTVFFPGSATPWMISVALTDNSKQGIRVLGSPGTTLQRLPSSTSGLLQGGSFTDWTFENITFDGNNRAGGSVNSTISCTELVRTKFKNCVFRDIIGQISLLSCRDVLFEDCIFYGTVSGVMAAGQQDPAANSAAAYAQALAIGAANRNTKFVRCLFHFCQSGVDVTAQSTQLVRGVTVDDCWFRGDWWNGPYVIKRFTATAFNTSTKVLTAGTGTGFNASVTTSGQPISFRYDLATGLTISAISNGNSSVTLSAGVTGISVGDVIETSTGLRGEIVAVTDTSHVCIMAWETLDTYEPTLAPAAATSCRVSRYYSTIGTTAGISDTQITLNQEPYNPFSGNRVVTDDGLDVTTMAGRIGPRLSYAGVQVNAGVEDLLVQGSHFRGSFADQISVFNSTAPRLIGNWVEYGEDEGTTLTNCPGAVVVGNTYRNQGTSGVAVTGTGHNSTITGNTIHNWGLSNYSIRGGIENFGASRVIISDNAFEVSGGGQSAQCVGLYGTTDGCIVSGNRDGGAKVGSLKIEGTGVTSVTLHGFALLKIVYTSSATSAQLASTQVITTPVTAVDGATVTFDVSLGTLQQVMLGGNRTLAFSNFGVGQMLTLILQQDGTGSRTVTWPAGILWAGGSAPTLTTTASKKDMITLLQLSAGVYLGTVALNF